MFPEGRHHTSPPPLSPGLCTAELKVRSKSAQNVGSICVQAILEMHLHSTIRKKPELQKEAEEEMKS